MVSFRFRLFYLGVVCVGVFAWLARFPTLGHVLMALGLSGIVVDNLRGLLND